MPIAVVPCSRPGGRAWPVALGVWLVLVGPVRADDPPQRADAGPRGVPAATAIILEPPADRDALLDKLRRPNLLLWDGEEFERWRSGQEKRAGTPPQALGVVNSVALTARPGGARAGLTVRYGITLAGDDGVAVPIGLDGLTLGRVVEAGTDRPAVPLNDRRGWAVELRGRGDHLVEVETGVPIRSTGPNRSLELAIPPAAATLVELIAARPLVLARAGPDEPLLIDAPPARPRAAGHLSPRGRVELAWQEAEAAGGPPGPVLIARGEVAITADLDALETRETWSVAALRGEARQVTLRLDAAEEVIALEVDRRPVPPSRRHREQPAVDELVVPLAEPLESTRPINLVLTTRRPRPRTATHDRADFVYEGHPIEGARAQSGVIGVARSASVEITTEVGPGLRRVDPRTDLPDAYRGRPHNWLGFEFAEQPFRLGLAVDPVAPRFEVTARTTVTLAGDHAQVATRLLGRVWQGKLFELRVRVPSGLLWRPTEPAADGPTVRPLAQAAGAGRETLVVTFAHPLGSGEAFAVPLRGTCRVPGDGEAAIPLFGPQDAAVGATEVALVSGPHLQFELADAGPPRFVRLDAAPAGAAEWSWPPGFDPNQGATVEWLRAERVEGSVRVGVATHPRSIRHRSSLTVAVDRTGADVVDEIIGEVAHGTVAALDVALPPDVPDRWVAEAGETLERAALEFDPATGWRRYRLKLGEPTDSVQIRLRYRVDFAARDQLRCAIEPVRVLEGTASGQLVRILSESDVELAAVAPGWTERPVEGAAGGDSVQRVRRIFEHLTGATAAPIEITPTLGVLADLPTLVASRLWLRSIELPGGALASTVQYRLEAHPRTVTIRLPPGSRWVRGMAGTTEIGPANVELLATDTYRITLPAAVASGPVPLRIDSILDQPPADDSWPASELVGGVVQQSIWELSLLGTRAGVGVPVGWTDENHWYRSGLVWKREPSRSEADLAGWLTNGLVRPPESPPGSGGPFEEGPPPGSSPGNAWAGDLASGRHSYLFSRPGPPPTLRFATFARATLVLLCSGPVLVVGLLILGRRPPPRWVLGALLVLALGLAATVELNTALLVAESSAIGFTLTASAALIHAVLDRLGRVPEVVLARGMVVVPSPSAVSTSEQDRSNAPDEATVIPQATPPPDDSTSEFPLDHRAITTATRFPDGADRASDVGPAQGSGDEL